MNYELSSDVLERQFGPTDIAILLQDEAQRIIQTQTVADGQVLELSKVIFTNAGPQAFPAVHRQVMSGESMGRAFRMAGVPFMRRIVSVARLVMPNQFAERFRTDGVMWVVEVEIRVGAAAIPYAAILETYSPAVDWPDKPAEPSGELLASIAEFERVLSAVARLDRDTGSSVAGVQ